jgi:hypothetical protein
MELDFTRAEYDLATSSSDEALLEVLAQHGSHYIKAAVARNPYSTTNIRSELRAAPAVHPAIIMAILHNPACSSLEFRELYRAYMTEVYTSTIHLALAASRHATIADLAQLVRFKTWGIIMAVLNNHEHHDQSVYLTLIRPFLPGEELPGHEWTEVHKLAYYRTYGSRSIEA